MKQNYFKHLFTALLLLCATVASAHDFEVGGIFYNILSEEDRTVEVTFKGTDYITYSNEYTGSVVIPTSVVYNNLTYSVTSIGYAAFYLCSGLTSVVIPNSVTSIGDDAFCACRGLTDIEIPNSVTSIGNHTFYSCSGLTSITIPNSVTSIGYSAFSGCKGLTSIVIPNSVTSIGEWAFEGCTGLTSVVIGDGVTSIGEAAFSYCSGLTSIVIPNSVISIGNKAFSSCSGLTSVVIGDGVTSIGEAAFSYCSKLTSIVIPNSVTSIGNKAFSSCSGLTSVVIGDGVTSIGEAAFSYCSKLTSIVIPNSVTSIGNEAFCNCYDLTSVVIGDGVTSIGNYAFQYCDGLTSVVIPNSVTSIGNYAFQYCSELKTVINLSNLKFSKGSSNYGYVAYYAKNVFSAPNCFKQDDYILFENEGTMTLVGYFGDAAELILPAEYNGKSVTSIESYAFYKCTSLTNVVIPNSVTSIGESAFYNCRSLTSVVIPNSVTSIGNVAFSGCTGLKTVINFSNLKFSRGSIINGNVAYYADKVINAPNGFIDGDFVWLENENAMTLAGYLGNATKLTLPAEYNGKSVTSIGSEAFRGCTGLASIEIPNSVTSIGNSTFSKCTGLTSVVIGDGVTSIGNYAFQYCDGLTSVVIPNSVTSIGDDAFSYCSGLTSIEIPNSVTSIGWDAFVGTAWYYNHPDGVVYAGKVLYKYKGTMPLNTSITIKEGTLGIAADAFNGCYGLTSIEIPNSVTSIGEYAFYCCYELTSVVIGDGVTSIGISAFNNCTGLTSVEIPNSVTSIGDEAFYECYRLTSVTIGNSVTSIGSGAFSDCSGLTSVTSLISADSLFAVNSNVFYNVDKSACTLYVPEGAKETYATTAGWDEFANIVELEPMTPTGDINADGEVNVGDFAALVNIIFNSESIDDAIKSVSDINADGEVNVGDFAALVNLIFNSGSQASPNRAATRAAADETTFYIEPFSIAAGETKVIPVLMENPGEKFSQLQFDITLPEGLEIPEYFDEEQFAVVKDIKRGSRTKSVYSIQTQPVGEALRVLCITQNSKATFNGESGDVLLITVKAADNIAIGDVEIKITNTVLSRQDGTTYKPADCTATVSVTDGTGIDDVKGENGEGKTIYDLQGRKVEVPSEGLYIIDSKKVVIK